MQAGKIIGFTLFWMIFLAACRENIDGPVTPTIAPTNTPNETEIALLWTDTPTYTPSVTNTRRPTFTPTDTASVTPSDTPTRTATFTRTPSGTPTPSRTPSNTPTDTPTFTPTRAPSRTPTRTHASEPTDTPRPTRTPSATFTATATVTPLPTDTRTPTTSPTFTPNVILSTATQRPRATDIPVVATPTNAPEVPDETTGEGEQGGTALPFASITPLPTIAPVIPSTFTPVFNGGGSVPEGDSLFFINPSGEIASLSGSNAGAGRVFDIGAQGQMAVFGNDGQLYANGEKVLLSPSSGFGLAPDMYVRQMNWSPDGRYLAVVFGSTAGTDGVSSAGVWVMDFATMQSWQILRDAWDVTSLRAEWSPNSTAVLITTNTPSGIVTTFLPAQHDVNNGFRRHPYQDSTWSLDSASVIVSGLHHQGYYILGRVNLDWDQTYVPYDFTGAGVSIVRAAAELPGGQIAFLGATDPNGPFTLYRMTPPNGTPTAIVGGIPGPIATWEWNRSRSALLIVTATQQLWIVRTNGTLQNATPPNGMLGEAHWN